MEILQDDGEVENVHDSTMGFEEAEDLGVDDRLGICRGLLFATPISLLLWWFIIAMVKKWL